MMFRLAEEREIRCLLQSLGVEHLRDAPTREADQEAYRKYLSEEVRSVLLMCAFKYIPHQLKADATLVPEVERVTGMKFTCGCMTCTDCESICLNFSEGVLAVLERDFIQLMHGEKSYIFEQSRVRFLLAGITLCMLYVSVPTKSGIDELILSVLILMMNVEKWVHALNIYGPVEPIVVEPKPNRSITVSKDKHFADVRSRLKARRSLCTSGAPPSPAPSRANAPPTEINRCVECKKPFTNDNMLQECDCSAVTVRYYQQLKQQAAPPPLTEKFPSSKASTAVALDQIRGRSLTL